VGQGLDPDAPNGDTDSDGLSDVIEVGGDIANPLDSDNDGVINALEEAGYAADASVIDGLALVNGSKLRISTAGSEKLSNVIVVPITEKPPSIDFSLGVVTYSTTSTPGGSVNITMTFSDELPENLVIYKLDGAGTYVEVPANIWRQVNSTTIDVVITDGDPLTDMDGILNGLIRYSIAVGAGSSVSAAGQVDGGGGGCVLAEASGTDPILPMLILIALIGLACRRPAVCKYEA